MRLVVAERDRELDRPEGLALGAAHDAADGGAGVADRDRAGDVADDPPRAALVGEAGVEVDRTDLQRLLGREDHGVAGAPVARDGEVQAGGRGVDLRHPVAGLPAAGGGVEVPASGEGRGVRRLVGGGQVDLGARVAERVGEDLVDVAGGPEVGRPLVGHLPVDAGLDDRLVRDFEGEPFEDIGAEQVDLGG